MVKYAGAGDSGDIWTATATSNLDMNNFSIVNVNTIQILQTATTGQALEVYRNLAADDTDSPIICFANQNAADDQSVLTVTTASMGLASAPMVLFETTDAAFNQLVLNIVQAGVGDGLLVSITAAGAGGTGIVIDQDADSYGVEIQSAATTNTQYGLQVVTGSGATAANIQYSGSEFARLGLHNDANGSNWFYRNLAAADTAGAVLKIENANAGDDQSVLTVTTASNGAASNPMVLFESTDAAFDELVLNIIQDGAYSAVQIIQNGITPAGDNAGALYINNTANERSALSIYSDMDGSAGRALVQIRADNVAFDQPIVQINNDGVEKGLYVLGNAAAVATAPLVRFENTDAAYDQQILYLKNIGTSDSLYIETGAACDASLEIDHAGANWGILLTTSTNGLIIDQDDTGTNPTMRIDRDGNNASDIWGLEIDCDNAGVGVPGGIDMTSFTAGEALLGIPVDANVIGTTYGRAAVYVTGVGIKYLEVFDLPA